jgi:dipeptidyl aminopeptidase/acylaminoacyl peptidase
MKALLVFLLLTAPPVAAEIIHNGGSADALPHDEYVRVVSEDDSPVERVYVKSRDGAYVAAAIRRPKGAGPFPAIVMFHGAPGGRGMEQLVGWSLGATGGPVWERFLQEGFVVVVADYRGGDWALMNTPSDTGLVTAIDDGLAVVDYVSGLPEVDASRVSLYGVSLGGNLVAYLISKRQAIHAAILGAPAPIWFLGATLPMQDGRPDIGAARPDPAVAASNVAPIETPVLLLVGTEDRLLSLDTLLHDQLVEAGKSVRMEVYEHGYHDFVLGPQGHDRPDLPRGEILMEGTLDALEKSVAFVKGAGKP